MSDEFDAGAAAAQAIGDQAEGDLEASPMDSHAAAEGVDASADVGSSRTIRDMLMSTEPSPSLEDVDDPWDPDQGGTARIMRGIMKATQIDGLPAIADVAIGAIEVVVQLQEELPGRGDGGDQGGATETPEPDREAGGQTFQGDADSGDEIAAALDIEGA